MKSWLVLAAAVSVFSCSRGGGKGSSSSDSDKSETPPMTAQSLYINVYDTVLKQAGVPDAALGEVDKVFFELFPKTPPAAALQDTAETTEYEASSNMDFREEVARAVGIGLRIHAVDHFSDAMASVAFKSKRLHEEIEAILGKGFDPTAVVDAEKIRLAQEAAQRVVSGEATALRDGFALAGDEASRKDAADLAARIFNEVATTYPRMIPASILAQVKEVKVAQPFLENVVSKAYETATGDSSKYALTADFFMQFFASQVIFKARKEKISTDALDNLAQIVKTVVNHVNESLPPEKQIATQIILSNLGSTREALSTNKECSWQINVQNTTYYDFRILCPGKSFQKPQFEKCSNNFEKYINFGDPTYTFTKQGGSTGGVGLTIFTNLNKALFPYPKNFKITYDEECFTEGQFPADGSNIFVPPVMQNTIGGTVTGLVGSVVLRLNDSEELIVNAGTKFVFKTTIPSWETYKVEVLTQPEDGLCTLRNGSGTAQSDITDIALQCATSEYSIGGSVSGHSGTVVLSVGGKSAQVVQSASTYKVDGLTAKESYAVTVTGEPNGQTCTVASAGSVTSLRSDVTNANVTCSTKTFYVSGNISGTGGGTAVLRINGANDLTITGDGTFNFPDALAYGSSYAVTVATHPSQKTCVVNSGSGTLTANVTNVAINCATSTFPVSGTITGLAGTLKLKATWGSQQVLTLVDATNFQFSDQVTLNNAYEVQIHEQPATKQCSISNASGTANAAVTNVSVSCVAKKRIYITAATGNGLTGGINGPAADSADGICNAQKPAAGTWKALLVDGTTRVACGEADCGNSANGQTNWVLAANTIYVRASDGVVIGTTNADKIFGFPLTNSFGTTSSRHWTGLAADWTSSANHCTGWTNVSSGFAPTGLQDEIYNGAIKAGSNLACNSTGHSLLCVEQ